MKRNEAKDKMQKAALNAWHKRGCRGVLQLATGAGKTRCALQAIKWVFESNPKAEILIIVPTTVIRDDTFPDEFNKWADMNGLLDKVNIQCIQTVYKWKDKEFDLVIGDEWHNYIPEEEDYKTKAYEYHKFFENNKCKKILGLSAWIPDKKRSVSRKLAPVAYTLTTDDAVELGIISPYIEFNIPVHLSPREQTAFNAIQQSYFSLEKQLGGFRAFSRSGDIMKKYKLKVAKGDTISEHDKENYSKACMFWKMMQKRKKFLYECPAKIAAVHAVIDDLGIDSSVIFSQATIFADMIALDRPDIIQYHSKVKNRDKVMDEFKSKDTDVVHLSTVMAVNEGMDIPKLPTIIIASRTSGAKAHIQRRGRCLRFEEGKTSYIFNLYVANTQDEKWLRKSQSTTAMTRICWVDDLTEVKAIIEKEKQLII